MATVSELPIVKRIMSKLGLGDAGKVDSFFRREIKKMERSISGLKSNLGVLEMNWNIKKDDLKEKLDDATEALAAAYDNVKPEDVANNAAAEKYAETYWREVDNATRRVDTLTVQLENGQKDYDEQVKNINEQMGKYQARIDKISK